jgi:hypothetical protein
MGYGDLFVAGLLGAVLATEPKLQNIAAVATFIVAALFDLLFFVLSELPATVPVALVLIGIEAWRRRDWLSAWRRRSTPAAATPPPET